MGRIREKKEQRINAQLSYRLSYIDFSFTSNKKRSRMQKKKERGEKKGRLSCGDESITAQRKRKKNDETTP